MAGLAPTLTKKEFQNWVKGALALLFTKDGLTDFVSAEVDRHHQRLLQLVPTANVLNTCNCTINSLPQCTRSRNHNHIGPGPRQLCSRGVCNILMDEICKDHKFRGPSWKNTTPQKWCTDAFEVAKCFFPPDGYSHTTSLLETDFNGIVSVIINNLSFASQIQDNLATEPNICTKARKVGREIRHTADHLLSDSDLRDYIDDLINLLCDPACLLNDPSAQDAVRKLRMLKTNDLTIHENDITEALKENRDTFSEEHRALLKKITDHFSQLQTDSVAEIDRIVAVRKTELEEHADRLKHKLTDDITRHAELKKNEIEQSEKMKEKTEFDEKLKDLKEDIITYYREHESVIPASPLVDEHNVPIEDLYVLPPMWAYKDSYFGQDKNRPKGDKTSGNDGQDKQEITISGLFLSGDVRYRKIYITANAGFGKTSLSQKLTMTWCQSQSPLESLAENYEETELTSKEGNLVSEEDELDSQETDLDFEGTDLDSEETDLVFEETELDSEETDRDFEETDQDSVETDFDSDETDQDSEEDKQESEKAAIDTLRYFDLLFLLHLRDYQCESKCNLDDLIIKMVSDKLSRNTQYTKEFLQRCLHEKKCLIILDGLDEWAHPGHCTRKPVVPHNNHPDSCTVLTTTRDWKIGTVGLSPKDIDRRVEISMLDDETRTVLEKNALGILNQRNLNLAGKNIAEFDKEVRNVQIGNIIYIPYILLQLMCLFFGGLPIGKSKCEIYSNITELTLKRGLKKKDLPDIHVQTNDNAAVPNCLKQNKKCNLYFNPIMKLGKLALCALFSEKKESSLIFDRKYAKQFMTKQEIEFCLKVGLLCQTKDSSIIAVKRYHVFFQHKSVQEFLSAIYITSEWQNKSVKSTVLNVCSSLSGILEMSNVFVFVCGMNPEVYTCISGELQTIVDIDDVTRRYRTYMDTGDYDPVYYDAERTMESYQSMQVLCLQESVRNGNDNCSIHLHNYFLTEEDLTSLKIIINFNKGNVKSLQLSDSDQITAFMQSLDPGVFTSLETLRVEHCRREPVWLADILTESARTLKCLTLSSLYRISLSDISIRALTGMTCLQSLYLHRVLMTHSDLKCLYACISQTTTLTQLKLERIDCSDHRGQYRDCDVTLDLHRLNELKMLYLPSVPCRELHVNPACLEKLEFWQEEKMTARASATLWQDLRAAPVLSSLTLWDMTSCQEMIQTIPTLTQLQHLKLVRIDMGDVIPRVSPEMTHLERVELQGVTMSSAAWQTLFFSIDQLPRSITVQLSWITMTSQEWRELLLSVGQLQHPVTVKLFLCQGPSEEWWTIVNVIKTTPTLSLLQDLSILELDGVDFASLTLKKTIM